MAENKTGTNAASGGKTTAEGHGSGAKPKGKRPRKGTPKGGKAKS